MYKVKSIVVLFCLIVISGENFSQKIVESMPLKMKSYRTFFDQNDRIVTTHFENIERGSVELLVMARKNWHLLEYDKNFNLLSNRKIPNESYKGSFLGSVKNKGEIITFHKLKNQILFTRILNGKHEYYSGVIVNSIDIFTKELGSFKNNNKIYYVRASKSKSQFKIYELSDKVKEYSIKFDKKKVKGLFKGVGVFTQKQPEHVRTKNMEMPVDIVFASGTKKIYPTKVGFDVVVDYKNEIDILSVNLENEKVSQDKLKVDNFKYLKGKYTTNSYMFGDYVYYITSGSKMFTVRRMDKNSDNVKEIFTIYKKFVPEYKYLNFVRNSTFDVNNLTFSGTGKGKLNHKKFVSTIKGQRFGIYVEDYDNIHLMVHVGALRFNNSSYDPFMFNHMNFMNQMQRMEQLNKLHNFKPPPTPTFRGPCPTLKIYPDKVNRFTGISKGELENDSFYTRFLITKSDLKYKTSKGIKPSIYARYNSLVKSLEQNVARGEYVKLNYLFKFNNKYYMSFYSKLDGERRFNIMEVRQ